MSDCKQVLFFFSLLDLFIDALFTVQFSGIHMQGQDDALDGPQS
jgi:hypothetical protein